MIRAPRSSPSPVSMFCFGSGVSEPSLCSSNSMKTRFQARSIAPSLKYWPNEKFPSISKHVRWKVSRPTSTMSGVRNTFCTVVSSGAGGSWRPRKNGISGCIPAEISSVERSSGAGISEAEGRKTWPFDSKNARKPARSSAVVRTRLILGSAFGGPVLDLRVLREVDLGADLLERPADQARDVHLRDADLLCDLRLRQAFEEPQVQDAPLPFVERAEAGGEVG